MSHGICEGIWLMRLLRELKMQLNMSMRLLCDKKATISIAKNPIHHDRTKHIELDRHFIKEKVEVGIVNLTYIPTVSQTADILTKALPRWTFEKLKSKLGMLDIHCPP